MIYESGFVRKNFQNKEIPLAAGIIFPIALFAAYLLLLKILPSLQQSKSYIFLLLIILSSFLGLIDDFLGCRETSGLKGHLGELFKGRMTTGGFKAVFGMLLAVFVVVLTGPIAAVPVNALLIALFTNAENLLDLRPGRAGKVFILIALLIGIVGWGSFELILLSMLLGSFLAYFPLDLKAKAMMGDTGSNALGAALGVSCVWILSPPARIVILLLLISFHLFTERYSLTCFISKNRFLSYLDSLGREKMK